MQPVVSDQPADEPRPPRKRRWWLYTLMAVGIVVVLAGTTFLALVAYYHSLIHRYTTLQPSVMAEGTAKAEDVEALKRKWFEFYQQVVSGQPTAPFTLSVDNLHAFVSAIPNLKDRVRLRLEDGRIQVLFSVPLDQANQRELKGRYLNGSAWLELQLQEDGFPALKVMSLEANGRAAPAWLAAKLKRKNFFEDMHRNPHLTEFINRIDAVTVVDSQVVITPVNAR